MTEYDEDIKFDKEDRHIILNCLRPSNSHRWTNCTGFIEMALDYGESDYNPSDFAIRGTKIHEYAKILADTGVYSEEALEVGARSLLKNIGKDVENETMINEAVQFVKYASTIRTHLYKSNPREVSIRFENKVLLPHILKGLEGRADFVGASYTSQNEISELHVVDLKTGAQYVKARKNPQLMLYALDLATFNQMTKDTKIYLHIVQNNVFAKNSNFWQTDRDELFTFYDKVKKIIKKINKKKFDYATGNHCNYCPFQLYCPKIKEKYNYWEDNELTVKYYWIDKTLSTDELSKIVSICEDAARLGTRYKNLLKSRLSEGHKCEEYELKTRRAPQKWVGDEVDIIKILTQNLPHEVLSNILTNKLQNPSQALKTLRQVISSDEEYERLESILMPFITPVEDSFLLVKKEDKISDEFL